MLRVNEEVIKMASSGAEISGHMAKEQKAQSENKIWERSFEEKNRFPEDRFKKLNKENLQSALDKLARTFELFNKHFKFKIHKETKQLIVEVVDAETGKVIKQIPPQEVLEVAARIHRMVGVLLDRKVGS